MARSSVPRLEQPLDVQRHLRPLPFVLAAALTAHGSASAAPDQGRQEGVSPNATPPSASQRAPPPKAKPPPHRPKAKPRPRKRPMPRKPKVVFEEGVEKTAAYRYAALDREACLAELLTRKIDFQPVAEARGVLAPVRLPRAVGGIVYRTEVPPAERAGSPWDVFDCRVVLALADWSPLLEARNIDEVLLFSAWRPPAKSWPADKPTTRHPGALAIDVRRLIKAPAAQASPPAPDATPPKRVMLDFERDWKPAIGAPVCGSGAPPANPATEAGRELRAIACELDDARLFTTILTPHYDRAHHNHMHLELTPEVKWRLVR